VQQQRQSRKARIDTTLDGRLAGGGAAAGEILPTD
jgi:hypothetical protein